MTKTAPFFSVVIPTYNREAIIGKAIESVLAQDFADYELIVVDDGSTDNTKDAVQKYAVPQLRYLYQQASGRPACPRNAGIRAAKGQFVAFLDSDDIWHPNKLQRVHAFIEQHPDADVLWHGLEVVSGETTGQGRKSHDIPIQPPPARNVYLDLLLRGNYLSTSATVVRRRLLEEVGGFDENLNLFAIEDYELWLRLAQKTDRFFSIPEDLGEYRIWEGGCTNVDLDYIRRLDFLLEKHAIYGSAFSPSVRGSILANRHFMKARTLHLKGEFGEALTLYGRCIRDGRSRIKLKAALLWLLAAVHIVR